MASALWEKMAIAQLMLFYVKACIGGLTVVSFGIILLATRSLRLAAASCLAALAIVSTYTGFMVFAFDFEVGMVEALLLMISVGLMLDPLFSDTTVAPEGIPRMPTLPALGSFDTDAVATCTFDNIHEAVLTRRLAKVRR